MNIKDKIYEIRGEYVMLDSDLAKLYECKNGTKDINKAVKRNLNKFPNDFYFQLTNEENESLRFQNGTTNMSRSLPHVFTQEGISMLATVLKTEVAAEVSVRIMRTFVAMRKYLSTNILKENNINNVLMSHENRITLLESTFDEFREKKKVNEIYFKGQIYDAYSKILDILKEGKEEVIIIDSFLDKSILDMIRNLDSKIMLITSNKSKLKEIDIDKYNMEYSNLEVRYNDTYHDRYIIIDRTTIYHLGASINHVGSKTFSINILEDDIVKDLLINSVN